MRITRICSIALVLIAVSAAVQPSAAACSSSRYIWSSLVEYVGGADGGPMYREWISDTQTPGVTVGPGGEGIDGSSVTANFDGAFWALGSGDPAVNRGDDSGDLPIFEWFYIYPNYPARFGTHWAADPRIDGCVDNAPTDCTAIQVTDINPQSGEVVFAVMSQQADRLHSGEPPLHFQFGQPGHVPFDLAPMPDPHVIGVTPSQTGLIVDVAALDAADFSDGLYLDQRCGDGTLTSHVPGACWLTQVLPEGSPPPGTDLETAGWNDTGICAAFGESASIPIDCERGSEVYVAYVPVNESDMPFARTSRPTASMPCAALRPFARFDPRTAKLTFGRHGDGFRIWARYALEDGSDDIFPDQEDVSVSFGAYSETIPAGSFSCRMSNCVYRGGSSGITHAWINRRFVGFRARGIDLSTTANPAALILTVGDDFGEAVIKLNGTLEYSDHGGHGSGGHEGVNDPLEPGDELGPGMLEPRDD